MRVTSPHPFEHSHRGEHSKRFPDDSIASPAGNAMASPQGFFQSMATRLGTSFTSLFNLSTDRPLFSLQTRGHVGYAKAVAQKKSGDKAGAADIVPLHVSSEAATAGSDSSGLANNQHQAFQDAAEYNSFVRRRMLEGPRPSPPAAGVHGVVGRRSCHRRESTRSIRMICKRRISSTTAASR